MRFENLAEYQQMRILAVYDPSLDPLGYGYHTIQSKIALGSGGLFGSGLYNGIQTQYGILPEKQTDFIFSVCGEELGFIGLALSDGETYPEVKNLGLVDCYFENTGNGQRAKRNISAYLLHSGRGTGYATADRRLDVESTYPLLRVRKIFNKEVQSI